MTYVCVMQPTAGRSAERLIPAFATLGHHALMSIEPSEGRAAAQRSPSKWVWLLSDAGIATAVLIVIALGAAGVIWMWHLAGAAAVGADQAKLELELLKFAFGILAGAGAVAALLLAIRRQRHTEAAHELTEKQHQLSQRAQTHTETDAAARRVTELYARGVEQIGSDKPSVRLGGLYALERLAQDNPSQRQTIVNVICAYLRMPYTRLRLNQLEREEPTAQEEEKIRESEQELQVRLTAQRILITHLHVGAPEEPEWEDDLVPSQDAGRWAGPGSLRPETFWHDMTLDLSGATLVGWDTDYCLAAEVDFSRCHFLEPASFTGSQFGPASFDHARFAAAARFVSVAFTGRADFRDVTFGASASFLGSRFDAFTDFRRAQFRDQAVMAEVAFAEGVMFGQHRRRPRRVRTPGSNTRPKWGAVFSHAAEFNRARFDGSAGFGGAEFRGRVNFDDAGVAPGKEVFLGRAKALGKRLSDAWPLGWSTGDDGALVEAPKPAHAAADKPGAGPDAAAAETGQPVA